MREYAPLFDDLQAAVARRVAAERDLAERFPPGDDPRERELQRQLRDLTEQRETEREQLEAELTQRREELESRSGSLLQAVDFAHREALREIERRHNDEAAALEQKYHDSTWVTSSVLDDTSEDSPKRKFDKYKTLLLKARDDQIAQWTDLEQSFQSLAERCGYTGEAPLEPPAPPIDRDAAQSRFEQTTEAARRHFADVERQFLPRLFVGLRSLWLFVGLAGALFVPLYLLLPPGAVGARAAAGSPTWLALTGGAACVAALILELLVYTIAAMRQSEALRTLQQSVAEAGWVHQLWLGMARDELQARTKDFEAKQRDVVRQRESALGRYESALDQHRSDIESRRTEAIRLEDARYHDQRQQLESQQQHEAAALDAEERQRLTAVAQRFESENSRLQQELGEYSGVRKRTQAQTWHALRTDWAESVARFAAAADAVRQAVQDQFPAWTALASSAWTPADAIPPALRFGEYDVNLAGIPAAIPDDARLAPAATQFHLPALLRFPEEASLLLQFRGAEGRAAAVAIQQTLLLRLLTQLPPGTLRLTILDPVGLGESFAGFMHLADFDEQLVTSRIWTEAGQIEARLADLTEHMENVFQKYLRNEFSSIEQYNQHAGEVAEPYHFLVISDFPAKFSDIAARRLTSILTSGPRCGVYTLLSADLAQPLPNNFSLTDVAEQVRTLTWRGGAFREGSRLQTEVRGQKSDERDWGLGVGGWGAGAEAIRAGTHSPAASPFAEGAEGDSQIANRKSQISSPDDFPLVVETPPPPDLFTAIVKQVGRESKDARRVEVSFGRIAPKADRWWTHDSRRELDIPLGRAGATKLQHLLLGRGTSQHMLVAGKTGSGKSTFLHAVITNLALHYSPEEVRFFLIDFKKGVEFKHYASCGLPHADVIAIESDREFGVSTLQRLDAVLQERGELFRRQGVQDIAGYRHATSRPLPRLLLVIDEFQEFFIEDDKLSQSAALLLDRLVRQGRAFGIHVVLGSQTLGGAYSLARSTLGQVAVRVALQCSEADAHLILSEANTAARLLSRPGEAIYNDANGLLEGNHPFQIAWLPDDERETLLQRLAALARERRMSVPQPVVFEGNIPSDPAHNVELTQRLLAAYASSVECRVSSGQDAHPAEPGSASSPAAAAPLDTEHSPLPTPLATLPLGDSVEIGPPTALTFERRAGSHLLLVGSDPEAAYGVMATGLLSLAASSSSCTSQSPASATPGPPPSLFLFDGASPGTTESQWWQQLCDAAPAPIRRVAPRDAATVLQELAAELARRQADRDAAHPPLFVCIYNLSKFRDLRKADDEFNFSGFGASAEPKPAAPGQLFADLVANGPDFGLHIIAWCDSASNLERWVSRQTLKEFENRIAFQMNAADSSNLIDSPAAAKLGVNRALLYREETGTSAKFRPYGGPSLAWLQSLRPVVSRPAVDDQRAEQRPSPAEKSPTPPLSASVEPLELATSLDEFIVT